MKHRSKDAQTKNVNGFVESSRTAKYMKIKTAFFVKVFFPWVISNNKKAHAFFHWVISNNGNECGEKNVSIRGSQNANTHTHTKQTNIGRPIADMKVHCFDLIVWRLIPFHVYTMLINSFHWALLLAARQNKKKKTKFIKRPKHWHRQTQWQIRIRSEIKPFVT